MRGKGGREREVPVPELVHQAIETRVKVHPLARGIGLRDEQPLFVRLGRHAHEDPVAMSSEAVYRLVHRDCLAAGVPDRLAHPHALWAYWPPTASRRASRSTRSQRGSVTWTCGQPLAMPPPGRSEWTKSPTCSTADTRPIVETAPNDIRTRT